MATLHVKPEDSVGLTVLLVSSFCGHPFREVDRVASKTALTLADGTEVSGLATVCTYIAANSPKAEALLGDNDLTKAQVRDGCCWWPSTGVPATAGVVLEPQLACRRHWLHAHMRAQQPPTIAPRMHTHACMCRCRSG